MKPNHQTLPRTSSFAARMALLAISAALCSPAIFAQDSSGNGLLNGSFRFRYVGTNSNQPASSTSAAVPTVTFVSASYGVMTFLGNGTYTIAAGSDFVDTSKNGSVQTIPTGSGGTYGINTAGIGYISNPDPDVGSSSFIYGTFSQGIFTGSSTEYGTTDLFVAMAVGPVPTNSTFTSPYNIGLIDFASGVDLDVKNALFQITPNGSGSLGTLSVQGQANNQNGTWLTQTVNGATYNFAADGNAQLNIPAAAGVSAPQIMISGTRTMYVSADGNFVLGWSPTGYDLIFGVKALPSSVTATDSLFSGLYYLGSLGDNPTTGGQQGCGPFGVWGSENSYGNENEVVHQRLLWPGCPNYVNPETDEALPFDFQNWDSTAMNPDGSAQDFPLGDLTSGSIYEFGDSGNGFVGISYSLGNFQLIIGVHAPSVTPSGIFLNPVGVINAASWAPVTASIAPGEYLSLFGNFGSISTPVEASGAPYPTALGNVQVLIGGTLAPLQYVSQNQINVIVPWELASITTFTAEIQVNSGGLLSNQISVFVLTDANPGYFAQTQLGIGDAAATHADGSVITGSNPALPGETIIMYLGGLGPVSPTVSDGGTPSASALSYSVDFSNENLTVLFQDYDNNVYFQEATVAFAGLTPQFPGEYQMNLTVPTTVGPSISDGVYVEIITPFADIIQVSVPIGGSANAEVSSTISARRKLSGPHPRVASAKRKIPR